MGNDMREPIYRIHDVTLQQNAFQRRMVTAALHYWPETRGVAGAIYWGDAGATLSNSREKEYGVAVTVDVPMAEWIPHLLGS